MLRDEVSGIIRIEVLTPYVKNLSFKTRKKHGQIVISKWLFTTKHKDKHVERNSSRNFEFVLALGWPPSIESLVNPTVYVRPRLK